ncbi:MAG: type II toxin-antitoxin system RelE/ParE family toxin [Campylobacterota bacterium]|nr:type II toxin-antitoxin system RelE/ParE family toxin [Campylobacterota bacterium]
MHYRIVIEPEALQDLNSIINYITNQDSKYKAHAFANELKENIASLSEMPMRCRKSLYAEDENTRDLIHKGYTIVFQIRNKTVYILTIFRQKAY